MVGGSLVLFDKMQMRNLGRGHLGRNLVSSSRRRLLLLAFGFSLCIAIRANWNSCYRTIAIGLLIFVNKRVVIVLRAGGSRTHRYRWLRILTVLQDMGHKTSCCAFQDSCLCLTHDGQSAKIILSSVITFRHFTFTFPPILDPSAIVDAFKRMSMLRCRNDGSPSPQQRSMQDLLYRAWSNFASILWLAAAAITGFALPP